VGVPVQIRHQCVFGDFQRIKNHKGHGDGIHTIGTEGTTAGHWWEKDLFQRGLGRVIAANTFILVVAGVAVLEHHGFNAAASKGGTSMGIHSSLLGNSPPPDDKEG